MSVVVYTDGGARNNPGPAGAGIVIVKDGTILAEIKQYLGPKQTNNWAEYEAVIIAFLKIIELQVTDEPIEFRLDSKLVVEQLMGNWKVKEPSLKPQVDKARALMNDFDNVTFVHIPREENSHADRLVNEAIDEAQSAVR